MTTEELVNAVRDAGFSSSEMFLRLPAFKHLIDSAVAAEREACAQVCEAYALRTRGYLDDDMTAVKNANAIRARSGK